MITFQNLSFSHTKEPYFQEFNFTIPQGQFCALMGPNGSGKSTLLKLLVNLLKPTSGQLVLKGKPIQDYSALELAKLIAYVPQREDFIFDFSVRDTVMMGRNPYQSRWCLHNEQDDILVKKTLEETHLSHLKDRLLSQLSGGELQRTLIARAMVQQAPIMLLDEPLANLDIAHKYEIMDILTTLQQETGVTIILILHDFPIAMQYASHVMMMQQGKIVHYGTCKEVLTSQQIKETFHLDDRFLIDTEGNIRRKDK